MKVINPTISDKGLLEPIVMKVTRWVLRREGGGDPSDLSDERFNAKPIAKTHPLEVEDAFAVLKNAGTA